jgi:hypothetical protein
MTIPGLAGYVAAMLYNQNNVAAEASPVTTMGSPLVMTCAACSASFRPTHKRPHVQG